MIKLTIPEQPISNNHTYQHRCISKGRLLRFMSKRGKEYKQIVQDTFSKIVSPEKKPVYDKTTNLHVVLEYRFKDRRKHDIDNYTKVLLDSLQGLAYADDGQITTLVMHKRIDKTNPGVNITILEDDIIETCEV